MRGVRGWRGLSAPFKSWFALHTIDPIFSGRKGKGREGRRGLKRDKGLFPTLLPPT